LFLALAIATLGAGVAHADPNPTTRRALAIQAVEQHAELDSATAARVEDVVDRYREPLKTARTQRRDAARELRLALRHQRNDDRVRSLEGRLTGATTRMHTLEAERMRALGAVLTPTQLGRLMMSWRAINHSLRHGKV
jgi:hypothetical protein